MRVLITGAAGTGTTTLGEALAGRKGAAFFDADSYFWLPSDPPYGARREPAERLRALLKDLNSVEDAVVAGSVVGWGEELENCFSLIVFLIVQAHVRLSRLEKREVERFGQPNADFLEWAAQYDEGHLPDRSREKHEQWLANRGCPVVRLEGDIPTHEAIGHIERALSNNALEADRDA